MKIGYYRVATVSQTPKIQRDALEQFGCEQFFADISPHEADEQSELNRLLGHMKAGDVLVVWRMDRLCSRMRKLFQIMEYLEARGLDFVSLEDGFDTRAGDGWHGFKSALKWSFNEQLPAGTARIYIWLDGGYGHVRIERGKTGNDELDEIANEAVKVKGCLPENGYPGFDVANCLIDAFGGEILRVEYGQPLE
jgi:hypothetical protein